LAGALPQTPLGKLTALPRPLAGFQGPTSKGKGGERKEYRRGTRKKWEGRGLLQGDEKGR